MSIPLLYSYQQQNTNSFPPFVLYVSLLQNCNYITMFTWIKKRCRRNSAPSSVPTKKHKMSAESSTIPHFYFVLEDEPSYEEVPESVTTSCETYELAKKVTSLTQQLVRDLSSSFDLCIICRKNHTDHTCSCCAAQKDPIYSKVGNIQSLLHKYSFEDYDIPSRSPSINHIYSSLPIERRRRLFRSRSDIRKRPLPDLPVRQEVTGDTESESSGFYEEIDSDDDASFVGPYMSESILV